VGQLELSDEAQQLISLVNTLGEPHLFMGNDIQVFTAGQDKMDAMLRDIQAATTYVHVQYFIMENDQVGNQLYNLLMEKARQGVRVRVLYDYVGSYHFSSRLLKQMRQAGVEIHPFLEVTFTWRMSLRATWTRRMHGRS